MKKVLFLLALFLPSLARGQTDPGVRTYSGDPWPLLPYIDPVVAARATNGRAVFSAEWSVLGKAGSPRLTNFAGLGPRYDALSCMHCHGSPTALGSGPATNQQYTDATARGATNTIPAFITANGPSVIPYVVADQTVSSTLYKAGSLLAVFTTTGRPDAPGCTVAQPPFATLAGNLALHQSIPLWGEGLVESVPISALAAAQAANDNGRASGLGITLGAYNVGTLGTKGVSGSLQTFEDFAAAVELGVTTRIYPRKHDEVAGCVFNPFPEDDEPQTVWQDTFGMHSWHMPQLELSVEFLRASAPPTPACVPASGSSTTCYTSSAVGTITAGQVYIGQQQFNSAGCDVCHTPTLTAGPTIVGSQVGGHGFSPYSDYAIHGMGTNGDGLTQAAAGPSQIKTSALWGLGYKQNFWHDGRTKDLAAAIALHSSTGSEGNTVISNYNVLSNTLKQDILDFLRSL